VCSGSQRANRVLGCKKYIIASQIRGMTVLLHMAPMRPHLKHYGQLWVPQSKEDIRLSGSVQRRVTKMAKGLEGKA